ncbi:MAG TPA: hypothetical protein DCZ10_09080 [Pelotomaculum sp.]|nr:hypothetical protein [Pelotomaculum sp.]
MVFQSLKWDENKIEFTQQKTGKPVTLPLLNDVGDAIIDYLKVRPQADTKHEARGDILTYKAKKKYYCR